MEKPVMRIDVRSVWQWRLWSRKPCSNHDITERRTVFFLTNRRWKSNTFTNEVEETTELKSCQPVRDLGYRNKLQKICQSKNENECGY